MVFCAVINSLIKYALVSEYIVRISRQKDTRSGRHHMSPRKTHGDTFDICRMGVVVSDHTEGENEQ